MQRLIWLVGLIIVVAGIVLLDNHPAPVSAGGWPCFLCHAGSHDGSGVVGTDLAPALAGSKLTDEQIIAQVRHPRGVMPAFSAQEYPDQLLKDGFIKEFARGRPTGQPTATVNPQSRAMALATMAAVAATRSIEYAGLASAVAIEAPTPAPGIQAQTTSPTPNDFPVLSDSGALGAFVALGAALIGMLVVTRWWVKR